MRDEGAHLRQGFLAGEGLHLFLFLTQVIEQLLHPLRYPVGGGKKQSAQRLQGVDARSSQLTRLAAGNRFDDRSPVKSKRFGTCYCGLDLEVAIAETILHDEMPDRGHFKIAYSEFSNRHLVRFAGDKLVLANLTGASLKSLAGDGSMSTIMPYRLPQLWSMAIHRHPSNVDGIIYMSRHVNDKKAVVIFDRARGKINSAVHTSLPMVRGALATVVGLRISFNYW
jgi:hypothetical protein